MIAKFFIERPIFANVIAVLTVILPSRSSRPRTCWLTAAWLTLSASPALVKLPASASAAKARSALREGNDRQSIAMLRQAVEIAPQ